MCPGYVDASLTRIGDVFGVHGGVAHEAHPLSTNVQNNAGGQFGLDGGVVAGVDVAAEDGKGDQVQQKLHAGRTVVKLVVAQRLSHNDQPRLSTYYAFRYPLGSFILGLYHV